MNHPSLQPDEGYTLRLMFDGGPLAATGTPEAEDMEDNDIINAEWKRN